MGGNELIGAMVAALGTILGVGVIVVKPIIQVVKCMAELNESVKNLTTKFNQFEFSNSEAHRRLWVHEDEQDEKIQDHEKRIFVVENRN
jgi:hypothetical protein